MTTKTYEVYEMPDGDWLCKTCAWDGEANGWRNVTDEWILRELDDSHTEICDVCEEPLVEREDERDDDEEPEPVPYIWLILGKPDCR